MCCDFLFYNNHDIPRDSHEVWLASGLVRLSCHFNEIFFKFSNAPLLHILKRPTPADRDVNIAVYRHEKWSLLTI